MQNKLERNTGLGIAPDLIKFVDHMSNKINMEPSDYWKNGLLYCGKCHTPKQSEISFSDRIRIMPVMCKCKQAEIKAEEEKLERDAKAARIDKLRRSGIQDKAILSKRFADAVEDNRISMCQRYCANFKKQLRDNIGLIFHGGVGTGKTFAAACIANELLDQEYAVLFTSFPRILALPEAERANLLSKIGTFDLIIFDDLGVERQSEYALEIVYLFLNERLKSNKPIIVTTNLDYDNEILNPKDDRYKRIYDRIIELCLPVRFMGDSKRAAIAAAKARKVKENFNA